MEENLKNEKAPTQENLEKHKTEKDKGEKVKGGKKLFQKFGIKIGTKKKTKKDHEVDTADPTKETTENDEENVDKEKETRTVEENKKLCALESYIKDLQDEIASLKSEVANYKEKIESEDQATDTNGLLNEEGILSYDMSLTSVKQDEQGEIEADDEIVEINLKEVYQSREYYANQLKVLESDIASLRERLKISEQSEYSKSEECEELKEGIDRVTNKLILAEQQISDMGEKETETNTDEVIVKMKADYEEAIEEERKKNKDLNDKLQAAMKGNYRAKEHATPSCFPCFAICSFRRFKAQYIPGAPTISKAEPEQNVSKAEPEQNISKAEPEQNISKAEPEQNISKAEPEENISKAEPEQNNTELATEAT